MTDDAAGDEAERAAQRAQVVVAVAQYLEDGADPAKLKAAICRQFQDLPRSTIGRWIDHAFKTGQVKRAAADAQAGAAGGMSGAAASSISLSHLAVFDKLSVSLQAIEGVLAYARGEDATKPRNPKLTLQAADKMIRAIQASLTLNSQLHDAHRLDTFINMMLEELNRESPELQARVLGRLRAVTRQFGI
ncbi:hypothetical protein EOD42_22620 [Rhodovarius crocodyli]|uniref:Uncharacterized protein n=1 Tax=Rhodovarius crocodyli TaxID=1979269 RepID=A0A437M1P1_9PROT|nr:hypothetical protein [Rhodovarius crocodyli]RVT91453.1 hypothetical protein EOD42_22620 [Rhodovarius crocodyli]